jgi:hypothetical protein
MYWWNRFIEFDRKPVDRDLVRGFVLEFSERLTLISPLDDERFELNGYTVIRNCDVRRWRQSEEDSFCVRALKLKGIQPTRKRGLSLASWPELLKTANELFPLITISRERIDRNVCQIGRLVSENRVSFELKEIDTNGSWEDCQRYKFSDLTRVDFGGGYEDALARVAAANVVAKPAPPIANKQTKSSRRDAGLLQSGQVLRLHSNSSGTTWPPL